MCSVCVGWGVGGGGGGGFNYKNEGVTEVYRKMHIDTHDLFCA
jgi:hypothetical protein